MFSDGGVLFLYFVPVKPNGADPRENGDLSSENTQLSHGNNSIVLARESWEWGKSGTLWLGDSAG